MHPCHPRRRFATRDTATVAGHHIAAKTGQHRVPEPCAQCRGWHLSHDLNHPPKATRPMPAPQPQLKTVSEQEALDSGRRYVAYDDIKRLLLDLDTALNGPDGRATAPSLCDIVGQVEAARRELNEPLLKYIKWTLE